MRWLVTLLCALVASFAVADRADLPADDSMRIGIKYKPADCPRTAKDGDSLSMHYTGTLYKNGEKFDSSVDRGTPFTFKLGTGSVIKGWEEGVQGMCVGEKRKLVIPSGKGYGARGSGKIHGGATLVFEIELMGFN